MARNGGRSMIFPARSRRTASAFSTAGRTCGAAGVGVALQTFEFGAHFRSVLIAKVAIFFEGAIDDVFEFGGEIGIEADWRDGGAIENRFEDEGTGVAAEGERARGHFVEDDAKREEVAARVHFFAADLFGGHVGDSAESGAGAGEMFVARTLRGSGVECGFSAGRDSGSHFCEAEVEDFCSAAFGDQDVRGFYVAVDDTGGVSGVERVGDFDGDFEEAFEVERAVGDDGA